MNSVLLVIAGLVQPAGAQSNGIDAVSSASVVVKNVLHAHTTSEIAYAMQGYLQEERCTVSVVSADSPQVNFDAYDLVIIGSGMYGMRPHSSVKRFIQSNQAALAHKTVALFAVCGYKCSFSEETRQKADGLVDKMLYGLSPAEKVVFCGRVNDSGKFIRWIGKTFFKSLPPGDYRDWNAIKQWTVSLVKR